MKRIVSGINPSGNASLHIGNYLGAVRQFKALSEANECFLFVADLHALTTVQKKAQLEANIQTLILNELALLGDLKNPVGSYRSPSGSIRSRLTERSDGAGITFFRQSDIPQHTELSVILSNYTPLGLIKRAHAYKDKLQKETAEDEINMGLFCYPILMTADILLYKPDLVPVGKDQKQHVEIARDIAGRFNRVYKTNLFKLPEPYISEGVATVLGTDGKRKMSKTLGNIISIFEDEDVIKEQVMSCYTDPTRAHANDPGHIEGNMVFTYLDFFGDKDKVAQFKEAYKRGGVGDVEIKEYLFESLMKYFAPARERFRELKADPKLVERILEQGAQRARSVAEKTMGEVRRAIGLENCYAIPSVIPNGVRNPCLALPRRQAGGRRAQRDPSPSTSLGTRDDSSITIDEFAKVELRVGKVLQAENVEKSEKLIRLRVDFGPASVPRLSLGTTAGEERVIFTGVRGYGYTPEDFAGKQFFFVTNLQYRKMMGEESQGMILAVDSSEGKPLFVSAEHLPIGATIR